MGLYLEILVLSPFFNKGLISEYFSLSRNAPVERTLLHMWVKRDKIYSVLTLKTFVDICWYSSFSKI